MSLSDDIDHIKADIETLSINLGRTWNAIKELADKIDDLKSRTLFAEKRDEIKSNGNGDVPPKLEIYSELKSILTLLAERRKIEAFIAIRRLTDCSIKEAKNLVEMIHVADHD